VPVAGIFHSGVAFEDAGVIAPLALAQRLGGDRGAASTVAVLLALGAASEAVSARIKRRFPGTKTIVTAAEAANASTSYRVVSKAVLVIVVLALVIGVISVTNTMAMAVLERQRELALLAAVGFSRSQIAGLILGEGVGLSVLGVALGLALGVVVAEAIVAGVASGALVSPAITAWGLGRGALVGVVIGVLGGLYPAWRVTRLRPAVGLARA
jgi:putative ABC transport system permease protein